jgi:hypothetical protein
MFLGHVAVGFASKRLAPQVSLGWLVAAPLFLDLVWPVFLAVGIEQVRIDPGNTAFTPLDFVAYPYSHSLAMSLLWGAAFGSAYYSFRQELRASMVLCGAVASHWLLDWVSHRADLPLTPTGSGRYGLGLWQSVPATVAVEIALLALGLWIYLRSSRIGLRLWVFLAALSLIYVGNILGSPPPSVGALTVVAFAQWLLPLWAGWAEIENLDKKSPSC